MNQDNSNEKNNINDSHVAPTDLRNTDIEMFGQENIPIMDMNRKASITDFDLTTKNTEFNNIGTVPPGAYTEKDKKSKFNLKRFVIIFLIFIIIAIIGGALYFYLSSTRKAAENAVITKNVELNVGDKISLKLNDYAEFKNVKATNCILNIKDVDNNKVGKYTYTISCGVNDYKGTITVVDKKAPEAKTQVVFKQINEEVNVIEFIESCEDFSECSYVLMNFDELTENLKNEGTYTANIEISDKNGNKVIVSEYLIVSDKKPDSSLKCRYKQLELKNYQGYYLINERVSFIDGYGDLLISKTKFFLEKEDDYKKLKTQVTENNILEIEGISGTAFFDEKNLTITIASITSVDEESYFTNTSFESIEEYYSLFGYSCEKK